MQEETVVDAELTVGFLNFKESYVSVVTCIPFKSVEVCGRDYITFTEEILSSHIGHRIFFNSSLQNVVHYMAISEPFTVPDIRV
jgi:hypothetical protein